MNKQKIIAIVIGVVCVGLVVTSWYFYSQWKKAVNVSADNTQEVLSVAEEIGRHIQLPQDETPTLATVSDKEKLKDQQFFAAAENGDKVLIYSNARKAILYRPSIDRIIEVAPIFFNDATSTNPAAGGTSN